MINYLLYNISTVHCTSETVADFLLKGILEPSVLPTKRDYFSKVLIFLLIAQN